MFATLWILNLAVLVGLVVMAWSPKYGAFRGSAVNPLIIFVVFSLFFNINFAVLHGRGTINIFERALAITSVDTLHGYVNYSVLFMAAAAGLIAAQMTAPLERRTRPLVPNDNRSRFLSALIFAVIMVIGLLGAFITLKSLAAILSGKINRQMFFIQNPLLQVAYSVVCPGLAIYLSARNPTKLTSIFATLGVLLILSVTGSRGIIILVGFIFLIGMTIQGRKLPAQSYLLIIPALGYLLAISRYLLRESWRFRSFADFVEFRGGFGELFFNSAEVAMAEAITTISTNLDLFERPPFESILGFLMYPLPRSFFSFKPFGASGYFTEAMSPVRWQLGRSEILTTGYGDFLMQFGLWAAVPLISLLAFAWLRGCFRAIHAKSEQTAIWLPFLTWWMYIFMRGSVFNIGASVWPFMAVLCAYALLRRINLFSSELRGLPLVGRTIV